ncbi:MAG: CDP-alcohol phosphatidyltransferase family protein, partial [Candidatus Bathyarchaeia archaeon]
DAAVYIGIIMGKLCEPLWGSIAIAGALLVSYSRARAEAAGVKMESVGLAERAERIFILAAASLTALFWEPTTVMNVAMILLAVLSHLTVLQRSIHAYKQLKKSKNEN